MRHETLELSRRWFFGATSAALVAMMAPKRAYSFLWENPLSHKYLEPVVIGALENVLVVTSSAEAQRLLGGSRRGWDEFFKRISGPVTAMRVAPDRIEARARLRAQLDTIALELRISGKERA